MPKLLNNHDHIYNQRLKEGDIFYYLTNTIYLEIQAVFHDCTQIPDSFKLYKKVVYFLLRPTTI